MNAKQTLSCSNCGAPLPHANTPTLTCQYCGTTMVNPFYKTSGDAPSNLAVPQINVIVSNVINPAQPVQGAPSPAAQAVPSPRSWWVTMLLALFFGVFGAHRFYTGYILIGLIQLFTFGGFGIWMVIDMLLLLTGNYHDKKGRPIKPASRWAVFVVLALIVFLCLMFFTLPSTSTTTSLTLTPAP